MMERFDLRFRLYFSIFMAHRRKALRYTSYCTVFLFGLFKGYTLRPWTFTQDVVYFTLPYRLRVITSLGYVFGMFCRSIALVIVNLRNGVSPTKNFSKLLL